MPIDFSDLIPQRGSGTTFADLISQRGLASMLPAQSGSAVRFDDLPNRPGISGARLNFDDIVPQNAAPSGGRLNFDDLVPQQASSSDIAADVAKSGGIGVLKGTIGLAGLPAELGDVGAHGIDLATRFIQRKLGLPESAPYNSDQPTLLGKLPDSAAIRSGIEQETGPLYEPKTTAGKYAETVGSFAPAVLGGPESLGARLLGRVVAPGLASEAAGQATEGTAAEPIARIGGAVLGGVGAAGALRGLMRSADTVPSAEELQSAINGPGRGYNSPAVQDLRLAPEAMGRLADNINADLLRNKIDPLNAPNVSRTINQLGSGARFEEPATQTNTVLSGPGYHIADDVTQPAPYQIADIDLARQSLGDAPFEERRAAAIARSAIDNYLGNIPQSDVVSGNAAAANRALTDARGNVASLKRATDVSDALQRAENQAGSIASGHGFENATRQQLRPILNQKQGVSKVPGFEDYTDDELAALKGSVNGSFLRNTIRDVGNQLGRGGGLGNISAGLGAGVTAHEAGADPLTSIGLGLSAMAGGRALGGLANRMTAAEAERMAALLRSRSPLGAQMRANAPPAAPLPNMRRNLLRGAVLSLPSAQGQ